jgi:glycosyltransferase involved in cell wall biosynthesis
MNVRIHVATREPMARSGGLHNYVGGLVRGQREIGRNPYVLERVSALGSYGVANGADRMSASNLPDCALELHFAYSALPMLLRWRRLRAIDRKLLHFHGPWYDEGRVQGNSALRVAVKRSVEALVYRWPGMKYVAASDAFASRLSEDFGIGRDRISVVYPGVDTHRFRPGEKSSARGQLGLPMDRFIFATVRRLEPRMGLELLLDATAGLSGCHLAICGAGTLEGRLRKRVADLNLTDRVTFLGRVSDRDLPLVYQAADVSVVPTIALEGFGLIVLESMACGRPVISSRSGGLPEAQGPFCDEWTVPVGDVSQLCDRMRLAMTESSFIPSSELVAYARSRSLVRMATEVEEVLAS